MDKVKTLYCTFFFLDYSIKKNPLQLNLLQLSDSEETADRLVIDEASETPNSRSKDETGSENGEDVPQCQGCNQKAAQFVCAGCGNQWYCSRECQVRFLFVKRFMIYCENI